MKSSNPLTPRRKGRKGGFAENPFIVFLIECGGVKKISRKDNRSLNISLGALCAFEWLWAWRANRSPRILIRHFLEGLGLKSMEKVVGEIRNLPHIAKNP